MLKRFWPYLLFLPLLTACPGGDGKQATLSVSPVSFTVPAGGPTQTFTATVTDASGTVAWTLEGLGSLSTNTGETTTYTPPALASSDTTATLTAALSGTSLTAKATIILSANAGNLTVTVGGVSEEGVKADITVTGPKGFSKTLTASETLTNLVAGVYSVVAKDIRVTSGGLEFVRRATLQGNPATIKAGETSTITVQYDLLPRTGALFVPSYSFNTTGAVGAFSAAQLASSTNDAPALLLEGTSSAQGLAFDKDGNLWVSDWDANKLSKYTPDQLLSSGTPTAEVVISTSNNSLRNPTALAFDKEGSLWVTNRGNATIVKYRADQLATTGSPKPAVILSDDGSGNLSGPTGIAFDKNGGLWFSNYFSQSLYNFSSPNTLSGAVNTSPDVILSTTITGDTSIDAPSSLAFDKDGNLWVSNNGLNNLVKFTPEQLSSSGTPVPAVTLSGLSGPGGLAFDAGGNLWVSNSSSTVVKFAAATLATTGSPTPEVVLGGLAGIDLGFLAFNPPPSTLPLVQK